MTAPSATELELLRLGRLLDVDVARLDGLRSVPVEDLKRLREQIAGRLFDEGRDSFHKAATVANMVPTGLAARLARHALGPVLAARTTAVTAPDKAVELARKFPPEFLADVAEELDPRAVSDLVVAMPPEIIASVGNELATREQWLVMADFVGAITAQALSQTMDALSEESILRVSRLLEDRSRLDEIVGMLTEDRLSEIVAVAEREGLTEELADLVESVSPAQRARIPRP